MNVMMSIEAMFHILQQGPEEGTPSFETLNQAIKNISKDINVVENKART
jgi:hypothetical protein